MNMVRRVAVDVTEGVADGFKWISDQLDERPWVLWVAAPLIVLFLVTR